MKICNLGSGSDGNLTYIETARAKVLLDAGLSATEITKRLALLQVAPEEIDAILITHEHSDHVKGLGTFSKKFNIPVYANKETWDAMKSQREKIEEKNINYFSFDKFSIKDLDINPFSILFSLQSAEPICK